MDVIEGFYCISNRANVVFKLVWFMGALVLFLYQENEYLVGNISLPRVLVSFCVKIQLSKISKAEFSSNLVSVLKRTICTANCHGSY